MMQGAILANELSQSQIPSLGKEDFSEMITETDSLLQQMMKYADHDGAQSVMAVLYGHKIALTLASFASEDYKDESINTLREATDKYIVFVSMTGITLGGKGRLTPEMKRMTLTIVQMLGGHLRVKLKG